MEETSCNLLVQPKQQLATRRHYPTMNLKTKLKLCAGAAKAKSAAIPAQKPLNDYITSSQVAAMITSTEEYEKAEMEKQAPILASSSTTTGNKAQ
jgi:hypothetical protein